MTAFYLKETPCPPKIKGVRIKSMDEYVKIIQDLEQKGYIFRGQEDEDWYVQPKLFREIKSEDFKKIIPDEVAKAWLENNINKFRKAAQDYVYGYKIPPGTLSDILSKTISKNIILPEDFVINTVIDRISEIVVFVKRYWKASISYEIIRDIIKIIKPDFFTEISHSEYGTEKFYFCFMENQIMKFFYISFDTIENNKKIFFEKYLDNIIYLIIEVEGYMQHHYGDIKFPFGTAAMDWTTDPLIATCFALRDYDSKESAIFALKECNSDNSPILIDGRENNKSIKNQRIVNQKGLFISFKTPLSFYFHNGRLPILEDYFQEAEKKFDVIKIVINKENLDLMASIKQELKKNNISIEKLMSESTILAECQ